MINNPEPALGFQTMRLQTCKLEVTCLQYIEQMLQEKGATVDFKEAVFVEVSIYGA